MNYLRAIVQMQQRFLLFYNKISPDTFRTHHVYRLMQFFMLFQNMASKIRKINAETSDFIRKLCVLQKVYETDESF